MNNKEDMLFLEIRENVKNVGLAVTLAACFCLLCATLIVLGVGNVWQLASVHALGIGVGLIIGKWQTQASPRQKIEEYIPAAVVPVAAEKTEVQAQTAPEVTFEVQPIIAVQSEPVVKAAVPATPPASVPPPEKKITIKKKQKA